MTTISTKRGTLDLTKHMDPEYIEQILAMGSWSINNYGYIMHVSRIPKMNKYHGFQLHRVVWELVNGPIPEGMQIDHIDGNRTNNFLVNLRVVTHQQNCMNRTKAKGYCWHKITKKWISSIKVTGKLKHLGYFNTEAEARQAYLDAKKIYHII